MAIDHRLEIQAKMRRSIGKCGAHSLIVCPLPEAFGLVNLRTSFKFG
jgi:hypothetical protein